MGVVCIVAGGVLLVLDCFIVGLLLDCWIDIGCLLI